MQFTVRQPILYKSINISYNKIESHVIRNISNAILKSRLFFENMVSIGTVPQKAIIKQGRNVQALYFLVMHTQTFFLITSKGCGHMVWYSRF